MTPKSLFLLTILGSSLLSHSSAFAEAFVAVDGGAAVKASAGEESLYAEATRAINAGRWSDAEGLFNKVALMHGTRADGALYWKAYAESKEGRGPRALATCAQLRATYPKSRWLEECGALEIELRGKNGQPVSPQTESNEDLKLLALNSLMQQDEARALPIIRQILNGNGSEKLKERALFVLAQNSSPQAQEILKEIVQGNANPELQIKAIRTFGIMRGKQSADTLASIYQNNTHEAVRKAILQSYAISGNADKLLDAAKHESNPELLHQAISGLGIAGRASDLESLYQASKQTEAKAEILKSLLICGKKGEAPLRAIAASEQDPRLQQEAIRNLGLVGGGSSNSTLVEIYQKSSSPDVKKAALQGLFLSQDAHALVVLAKSEKDPAMKHQIIQNLSLMHSKEASAYMLELLDK